MTRGPRRQVPSFELARRRADRAVRQVLREEQVRAELAAPATDAQLPLTA